MEERIERIREVLDWLKSKRIFKSNRDIAERMGYNPCMLSQVITGKSAVSSKFVRTLCNIYPGLRYDWIWNGKGDMLSPRENLDNNYQLPAGDLDRYTYVMVEMANTMKSMSMLVGPITREMNELRKLIERQNQEIQNLKSELNKIKDRH